MSSRKRRQEGVSDDEGPAKRQKSSKKDFTDLRKDEIREWAIDNEISRTQAEYIAQSFSPNELLNASEADLRTHKKLSRVTISRLLAAIQAINSNDKISLKDNTSDSLIVRCEHDLNTEEGVFDWFTQVVSTPPKSVQVSDIIRTMGADFPHCVSEETKQTLYQAAVECQRASKYGKDMLSIPFINGGPGIGKTRMALETMNILKECAAATLTPSNEGEESLKEVLASDKCVTLYISFGKDGSPYNNQDKMIFDKCDSSAAIVIRALWKSYLEKENITFDQVLVTDAMATHLTLHKFVDQLKKIGIKYIVLVIDEMKALYDADQNAFRRTIISLCTAVLINSKNLFVVLAGSIHAPLKSAIIPMAGAVDISPVSLSLANIEHILNASAAKHPYLAEWQKSKTFRQCLIDLSNPPRALESLLMEINKQIEQNSFTLDYQQFMPSLFSKYSSSGAGLSATEAQSLISDCLTKTMCTFGYYLPGAKRVDSLLQEGHVLVKRRESYFGVQLSVPYVNLCNWLKLDPNIFGCTEQLFKPMWNDSEDTGLMAWKTFNVKYTALKLTLCGGGRYNIPFTSFHAGALLGVDCEKCFVQCRAIVPVIYEDQFPASCTGGTEKIQGTNKPSTKFDAVYLDGKIIQGIAAFYWIAENVIELQSFLVNDSNGQTPLTQKDIDGEYYKAAKMFGQYLSKHNYQFVFGLVSNKKIDPSLRLPPNMYLVHKGNMEEYYGPLAGVAQIKGELGTKTCM